MREQPDCVRSCSQMSRWGIGLAVNTGMIWPSKTGKERFSSHTGKSKCCFASSQRCSWSGREREWAFIYCSHVDAGVEKRAEDKEEPCSELSGSFGLSGGYCLYGSQSEQSNSFSSLTGPLPRGSSCIRDTSHRPSFWELHPLHREYSSRAGPTSIMANFHISRDHQSVQKLLES